MSDNDDSDYYSENHDSDEEIVKNKRSFLNKPTKSNHEKKQFGIENYDRNDEADDSEMDMSDNEENEQENVDSLNEKKKYIEFDEINDDEVNNEFNDDDSDDYEDDELDDHITDEEDTKQQKKNEHNYGINDYDENSEEEYDDDYDETYLQKFNKEINNNYIQEFHPECLHHNNDEIMKLTKTIRDENNIIIDPLHKTLPFLTKYEKARILGQRSKQIENGSKPFINVPENVIDSYVIAELELREKKIPFIIKRPIPGGGFEYWSVKDLEHIHF